MATETSPAFQFYVKEWRSSRPVMRMTFAQRGMYLEMLLEQWENLSLPDSPEACADIIGGDVAEWVQNWPTLRKNFVDCDHGRIQNEKLESVRKEKRRYSRVARKGGLARAKAATRGADGTYVPATHPATSPASTPATEPALEPAVSSTPTATATATPTATASSTAGRRNWIVYKNKRFAIWAWQMDEFVAMLGPNVERFELDVWLDELGRTPKVIPPELNDRWRWIRTEFVAACRARGLSMADEAAEPELALDAIRAEIARQDAAVRR